MKKIFALILALLLTAAVLPAAADGVMSTLRQKIATRSGPSTAYDGTGTYLINNWKTSQVKVFSRARGNDIWWLQVEFTENGRKYRAYTGQQRLNIDVNAVPEEQMLGYGSMIAAGEVTGYFGPGTDYTAMQEDIPWSVNVTVWGAENGWLLVDFYDVNMSKQRRAWVFSDLVQVNWLNGAPAGSIPQSQANIKAGDYFWMQGVQNTNCTVLQYGQKGGYTIVRLNLYNKASFPSLVITMEGNDYGTFQVNNGGGDVWFYSNQVVLDVQLPDYGIMETIVLKKPAG